MQITTIGLDLAKRVFQVHGVDASGEVKLRKRLRRSEVVRFFAGLPPCLVGMEACATAHYWARELSRVARRSGWSERRSGWRPCCLALPRLKCSRG